MPIYQVRRVSTSNSNTYIEVVDPDGLEAEIRIYNRRIKTERGKILEAYVKFNKDESHENSKTKTITLVLDLIKLVLPNKKSYEGLEERAIGEIVYPEDIE